MQMACCSIFCCYRNKPEMSSGVKARSMMSVEGTGVGSLRVVGNGEWGKGRPDINYRGELHR